jgi:transmembrane 9 superfamily protein 2/4
MASIATLLILTAILANPAKASNLFGVMPSTYGKGQNITIYTGRLNSIKTLLPFDYYSLDFCRPDKQDLHYDQANMGERLTGNSRVNTLYKVTLYLITNSGKNA